MVDLCAQGCTERIIFVVDSTTLFGASPVVSPANDAIQMGGERIRSADDGMRRLVKALDQHR
jgi:hypothetical protein